MKIWKILITSTFLFFAIPVVYADKFVYDSNSGNYYKIVDEPDSNTGVVGTNPNTGATWATVITPTGDKVGINAQGQYWEYHENSGYYHNAGTGLTCLGKSPDRICTY